VRHAILIEERRQRLELRPDQGWKAMQGGCGDAAGLQLLYRADAVDQEPAELGWEYGDGGSGDGTVDRWLFVCDYGRERGDAGASADGAEPDYGWMYLGEGQQ
jgi:hypothetical protein